MTQHKTEPHPAKKSNPDAVAQQYTRLQAEQDEQDRNRKADPEKKPAQMGARAQPEDTPATPIRKPGLQEDMELQPQTLAPNYLGSAKLDQKVAIITGGDSGIGRAVAVLFAREGANVAVVYLNEHDDAAETRRLVEAEGRECILLSGDVKDMDFCRSAVAATLEEFGKLDILVNNAAFQEHAADISELTEERFQLTLMTNVGGYFHMAKAALEHMKEGSAIINTGSVTGLEGEASLLDYSATKGAIHALTKSLAANLLPRGIRVNAVAPGPVWTPLNPADGPADKIKEFGKWTQMGRAAQPEELSPAYVFLAAPVCSGYITGIVLPVTGDISAI